MTAILGYRSISPEDRYALKKLVHTIESAFGANSRAADRLATLSEVQAIEKMLEKVSARLDAIEQQLTAAP